MAKHSAFYIKRGGICAIFLLVCIFTIPICLGEVYDYSITKDIDELPYSTRVENFSISANRGAIAELTTDCEWVTLEKTRIEFIDSEEEKFWFEYRIPLVESGTYNCSITAAVSFDGQEKSADYSLFFEITNEVKRYDLTVMLTDLMSRMPISNGTVLLNSPTKQTATSNEDGSCVFTEVEEGCWDLIPSADGYSTERNFVCVDNDMVWIVDMINSSFDLSNATQEEIILYEQYLTEKNLRMYMNMKQHQPRVIETEKIVYQEIPYSPEAFQAWIEQYNPQSLNNTIADLEMYKGYTEELRQIRSDLANDTKRLNEEVENLKKSRNTRWILTFLFILLAIGGLIAFFVIRRRRQAGYVPSY